MESITKPQIKKHWTIQHYYYKKRKEKTKQKTATFPAYEYITIQNNTNPSIQAQVKAMNTLNLRIHMIMNLPHRSREKTIKWAHLKLNKYEKKTER